jgi:cyclic pyranopterin monophosphate synthase
MADKLTHFDATGAARMVDVTGKPETGRIARASALVRMTKETADTIDDNAIEKGDVLEVARLAGIMAAKRTADLIPLCHTLPQISVKIDFCWPADNLLRIEATVAVFARTGVEMEALTAVAIAALAVYDMCKSVDRRMTVESIRLEEKTGGKSGSFRRAD